MDSSAQFVKGVGPKLGSLLKRKGIVSVRDLLEFYPRTYQDLRSGRSIASLEAGDHVGIEATIVKVSSIPMGRTSRKIFDIIVRDATGGISCKYFRVPYRGYFDRFQPGDSVRVVGKVTLYRNNLEFHHPDISPLKPEGEEENEDRLLPIYSETEGLTHKKTHGIIKQALLSLEEDIENNPCERLPPWLLKKYNLKGLFESFQQVHLPPSGSEKDFLERKTPYHKRLIFEEFFNLEIVIGSKKQGAVDTGAPQIKDNPKVHEEFLSHLPFELTGAQKRVVKEVTADLVLSTPMNRLVQGDVGSGKTIVALLAALSAIRAGYQVAIMAPTEILAQQHYLNAVKLLEPLGISSVFLSGQLKKAEKDQALSLLSSGEAQLAVGTHALIQEGVSFHSLGLVVVDEQHRFGVQQRSLLKQKGQSPHFLLMTATPIPRSLAMTVFGDLDCSVIDELPKGRQSIVTRVTNPNKRQKVLGFVEDQLKKGRQAYVIYPLVDESEKMDLKSAMTEYERLKNEYSEYRVGLLHGKMKSDEKDQVMADFRDHKIDLLVSTTVIEVGVDVPNANLMWIEHAERFGLSQLHQLRGRVGRGEYKSYCILMTGWAKSEEATDRLAFMETTNDGFKISEYDLELRGPGEFLGVRQSGLPGFKMASLVNDLDILEKARTAAFELLEKDPELKQKQHLLIKEYLEEQSKKLSS